MLRGDSVDVRYVGCCLVLYGTGTTWSMLLKALFTLSTSLEYLAFLLFHDLLKLHPQVLIALPEYRLLLLLLLLYPLLLLSFYRLVYFGELFIQSFGYVQTQALGKDIQVGLLLKTALLFGAEVPVRGGVWLLVKVELLV